MTPCDRELLECAVRGDTAALGVLFERHGPPLRPSLSLPRSCRAVYSVDDVLQVAYLHALNRIGSFDLERADAFRGWLRTLARHAVCDLVRLRQVCRERPLASVPPGAGSEGGERALPAAEADGRPTPSRFAARGERQRATRAAVGALPEPLRTIVLMRDFEGLPGTLVATRLGVSVDAVRRMHAKAHGRLRRALGPESRFLTRGA